jgi:hypothetical protein
MPTITEEEKNRFKKYIEDWGLKFRDEPLIEGSYRWRLYLYSNLFERNPNELLKTEDKEALLRMAIKFKTEHLPNWVRDHIYDLKEELIEEYKGYLNDLLIKDISYTQLKIAIYGLRLISDGDLIVDSYMLKEMPELKKYADLPEVK